MFTGIIERVCSVVSMRPAQRADAGMATASGGGARLEIELDTLVADLVLGASMSINGVCLTLAERRGTVGGFDVVPETLRRSNLRFLQAGDKVNVERSLRVGDRLDGHFVQGHIDGTGKVDRIERDRGEHTLWVAVDAEQVPYIVPKGSIAIDGTSLTVVGLEGSCFSVALIPTTLERTTLGRRQVGDQVNIETDIFARLVVSRLAALTDGAPAATGGGLTWQQLQESGFLP
jgi:riboflavin synthase